MVRRSVWIVCACFGLVAVVAVVTRSGPGDRTPRSDPLTWSAEPPYVIDMGMAKSAAAGEVLVVSVDPAAGDRLAAASFVARRADGRWARLPDAPEGFRPYWAIALVSVGDSVVLAGSVCERHCGRDEISEGRFELYRLAPDLRSWEQLDSTSDDLGDRMRFPDDGAVHVWGVGGRHELAVVRTTAGTVTVDSAGRIAPLPQTPLRGPGLSCIADGRLLMSSYTMAPVADRSTMSVVSGVPFRSDLEAGTVSLVDPAEWERVAGPSFEYPGSANGVCTSDGLLYNYAGSEATFSATDSSWVERDDPTLGPYSLWFGSDRSNTAAVGPDGSLYVIGPQRSVLRRTVGGTWSDTGVAGDQVAATASQVLAFVNATPGVQVVP